MLSKAVVPVPIQTSTVLVPEVLPERSTLTVTSPDVALALAAWNEKMPPPEGVVVGVLVGVAVGVGVGVGVTTWLFI